MTSLRQMRPVAIILGGDVNGLGVARSLTAQNVPLLLLDTDAARPTMRTRHGRKLAVPSLAGPRLLDTLYALRARFDQKPVLFPTQEATLATLSRDYASVSQAYHLNLPEDALVQALLDKTRFHVRAEELGFRVPRSRFLRARHSNDAFSELRYPCVIKPAKKEEAYANKFAKAYRVSSANEAQNVWQEIQSTTELAIIQEWIDGGDSDVYFCLQYRPTQGDAVSFCGRKTLQWPMLTGGTATCIPAPEVADELTETTSAFFAQLGFTGLCSMEYKRDPRDGNFYMVEPTAGRTDYQEEIATLNGINIPFAAYCDLTGAKTPAPNKVTLSKGWRDPFGFANAVKAGADDPALRIRPGIKLIDAYFRTDDPMPFLQTKFAALRRRLKGRP